MEPKKLAIYYGWPSTVNATYSVSGAAGVFKDYDIVVFGAGLEDSSHGDHTNTSDIIDHTDMSGTEVFGYVTINQATATVKSKIDDWHAMGGSNQKIAGIFLDEYGYDYGITRDKQREIVSYIHGKTSPTLKAFVNSWKTADTFSSAYDATYNPSSLAHNLNTDDLYLSESFAVKDNAYDDTDTNTDGTLDWEDKADEMTNTYSGEAKMVAIGTTGSSSAGFTQAKADYSYYISSMYGLYAWGWGEKNYSSAGGADSLPLRTRKTLPEGASLYGSVSKSGDVLKRNTNVGFNIDTDAHTVSDRL